LTDTDLPAEEIAMGYKGLWRVEAAFRQLKDQLELGADPPLDRSKGTRPEQVVGASFREVLSDLGRVKAMHLEVKGRQYLARAELSGRREVAVPPRVVAL